MFMDLVYFRCKIGILTSHKKKQLVKLLFKRISTTLLQRTQIQTVISHYNQGVSVG